MSFLKLGRESKVDIDTTGKWAKDNEDTNQQLLDGSICRKNAKSLMGKKEFARLLNLKKLIRKKREQQI